MSKTTQERRLGKFVIHRSLIVDDTRGVMLREIMGRMLVIRAELMMDSDNVEYVAFSDLFDPLGEGEKVPWYAIYYFAQQSCQSNVKAIRQDTLQRIQVPPVQRHIFYKN